MASNTNLVISILAKDQASSTFRKIKVNLGELEKESAGAGEAFGDLGKIFSSGLGKMAGGVAGFFAVGQLTQTVAELGKMGAQAERTRAAYDDLAAGAGQSGAAMLQAMRTATAGTVADSELMLSANRAMMLGVADNAGEMSRLMAAAIERGRALGVSSSQAVNDIITGIGRMSPMILDNLGITGAAKAFDTYAASLGKTADQLTDVEKKQALVNTVLAGASPGGVVLDDAAAAFERMDASLTNAKEALGVLFSPAIAAIAGQIAAAAASATEGMQAQADLSARTLQLRQQLAGTLGATMLTGVDDPSTQQRVLALALAQTQQAQQQAAQEAVRLAENTQAEIAAIYASTPGVSQAGAAGVYAGQLAAARAATVELQAQAEQIAAVMGGWIGARGSQEEYNRSLWEGVAAWSAFQTQAQIATAAVLDARSQIMASAQGQLESIAREIAAVQGNDAGLDWLEMGNRLLDDQIDKWAQAGYTIDQIRAVLLPGWLANLGKVADSANKAQTAVAGIGKGAREASGSLARESSRMMQNLARVGAAGRKAATDVARIGAAMADAVSTGRGGGLGEGFRTADYVPPEVGTKLAAGFEEFYDTAYSGGGGGGIGGIADEFDSLQSSVQSVIDSAMGMDIGGLNPADFLPREDAINENARRLAAIMRDGLGNQEWMEEFKTEVPALFEELASSGDPKAAAARMLQEFQSGMRPELLDREMIKSRVRQMILGDESSAQLAQEIAAELSAEMGISLGQARAAVQGAMGIGGAGALPEGVTAGPDGAAEGTGFVSAWVGVVTGMVDQFDASGKTVGAAFSAGFLSTQPALLDSWASALVGKLIPAVVAALAAQGSRTGAQ